MPSVPPPCALAAMGMVNALGCDLDEIWERLLTGDQSRFHVREDLVPGRSLVVGDVTGDLPAISERLARFACRNNAMSLAALQQIESEIRTLAQNVGPDRIAVVAGTSTSGVSDAEAAIRHRQETGRFSARFDYAQLEFGGAAAFVADYLELAGPAYTISTACSSGARALASARSLLNLGVCDAVVAGATDTLCQLTTNGFSSLQAISDEVTNPCSVNRRGLTLGEGSVFFLVTRDREAIQLRGVGESSEAHHMSAPDPEGRGAECAMRAALEDARIAPNAVAYLNLHGTGTPLNDAMECKAIARVFPDPPPCSSTKSLVGHTLGAAGAMEAGFCWLALRAAVGQDLAPIPHAWDGNRDPELPALPLASKGQRVPVGPVLTNSFGFGGNNCSLVLQRSSA